MKKIFLLLSIAFCFLGFASCSKAEPRIVYSSIRLLYYQGENGAEEHYSVFIIPEDDDGIEDIEDLYIYHDQEGLRWHLNSSDWVSLDSEGQTWIGSRSLAMPDGEKLPRGQFRAVLIDKSGERSERIFAFDAPENGRFAFPTFEIVGNNYRIESGYPENHILFYNSQGNFLRMVKVSNFAGRISDIRESSDARSAALWAEDGEYSTAALTDIIPINP